MPDYMVVCDASCSENKGFGWGVIQDLTTGALKHYGFVNLLSKSFYSDYMETMCIKKCISKLPNNCSIILVSDCKLIANAELHIKNKFTNNLGKLSEAMLLLKELLDLIESKNINYLLEGKEFSPLHTKCHNCCHIYRKTVSSNHNYHVYALNNKNQKVTLGFANSRDLALKRVAEEIKKSKKPIQISYERNRLL